MHCVHVPVHHKTYINLNTIFFLFNKNLKNVKLQVKTLIIELFNNLTSYLKNNINLKNKSFKYIILITL